MPTPRTFVSNFIAIGLVLATYCGWAETDAPDFSGDSTAKLSPGEHDAVIHHGDLMMARILYFVAAACGLIALGGAALSTDSPQVTRGRYLVEVAGCGHCHTPGHFLGKEDHTRELGGSDVGFEVPAAGTFIGPNLTPDRDTGLGRWSDQQIIVAIRGGVRPDGRLLSPVMPWQNFSRLSDADAADIVAYLRSLKPVNNKVPGPYAAGEEPRVLTWRMFVPATAIPRNP